MGPGGPMSRRLALAVLAVVVTGIHGWLAVHWLPARLGEGAADGRPKPIEVSFVRDLAPAAPPATPPPAARPRSAVFAPQAAASAPQALPLEPLQTDPVAAVDAPALPDAPVGPLALAAPAPAVAASAPTAFEWPPSTRLDYLLVGNFRGPVTGQARVEWRRSGTRYQVNLELTIGPSFSPLVSRRISSDGEITPEGLRPTRYDEETRAVLRDTRRLSIALEPGLVRLPSGREFPRPPGVQDSASQFVQLTWLFTTQPQLLQPGQVIAFPLALPRQMDVWTYDVLATEPVDTPAGAVDAVHVKPRREAKAGSDLTAEVWFAPSLQYLPVRLLIRQDAETYMELSLERLPQQAEPGR
jgi:hypothetical protein